MDYFYIGNVKINNRVVLAPMAGITDSAYRLICKNYGASLTYSEMVSDKGLLYDNKKTTDLLFSSPTEHPYAIQIFGSDEASLLEAAMYIDINTTCDIIDINMGCPVPKIALKSQAGSALLKNPDKIGSIIKSITSKVSKPVTVKIRSGWDSNSINAVEVAKICELNGASAVTVHARTRAQGYTGNADIEIIKQVKEALKIPVIGNGDVINEETAKKMLDYTGCDAVMIGRKAIGNPFIFREINYYLKNNSLYEKPSINEIKEVYLKYVDDLIEIKGIKSAILLLKGISPHFFKGIKGASEIRQKLTLITKKEDILNIVSTIV
ncbi:MAG: tRNA dihydrouridine synthase DusB [Acholeplasmatales bacterium]|jgi:nifR3 family TIM-barrel protein|nr:tRNA dihydrouridine synthase DusB [Acholeplasmatales bacterium]